jgi:hypothetical protein
MRLYHSNILLVFLFVFIITACTPQVEIDELISIQINADGKTYSLQLPYGSTTQEALDAAELVLESLDKVEPPSYTVLTDGVTINLVRVREEFEVEQVVIPFEQQIQPSELLPEGDKQPLQLGENGLQEITYRRVYEYDVEVSRTQIKSVIVKEPVSQIMLVGVQTSFTPIPIPGRLAYLADGNAWMLEGTTANRIPIVNSGDLDGRIFSLSEDGTWLLFTRHGESDELINSLWAVNIDEPEELVDLQVDNVIHFANWEPGSITRVAYSTVEQRQAPPGWQANNDFILRNFSHNGWVARPETLVETNSGGVYGWWGTDFIYSPNGLEVAYAAPGYIGVLDLEEETLTQVMEITPLQTRSEWAWVPGVSWSPAGRVLYTVDHAPPPGLVSPEESPLFDLAAIPLDGGPAVHIVSQVGMFAYPLPSPVQVLTSGENAYQVAYLQAIFPSQSDTSRYRVAIMDRDGSNRREIFPSTDAQGIEPQREWAVWSPEPLEGWDGYTLALLYQGNLWLVDSANGDAWQITGDGRLNRVDWR